MSSSRRTYIFWLTILKRGIVAKGNHKVLATYVTRSNSKNSNKTKLVKAMYRVYQELKEFNWFKSWIYVLRYAFYSKIIPTKTMITKDNRCFGELLEILSQKPKIEYLENLAVLNE